MTVLDAVTRRPLPNVQVSVVGTQLGGTTNSQGVLHMVGVTAGAHTVRARLLGYAPVVKAATVTSGSVTKLEIGLTQSALELSAVVTTGTGGSQVEARKLGNTVANIEAPADAPIRSFSDVMQGREPGVVMLPSSGIAGEGARIRIRGNASLSQSNEPIVYVDGVRIDNGGSFGRGYIGTGGGGNPSRLDDIDPTSIDKIEVLKGAAAATLYGTEASNGVILITTKKGTQGAPKWIFDVEQAASSEPTSRIEPQYGFARSDTAAQRLSYHYGFPVQAFQPFTAGNFATRLFQTGTSTMSNAQVSGGNNLVTYYGGLRAYVENGTFTPSNYNWQDRGVNMRNLNNKYQGSLSVGITPSHTFKIQTSVLYADTYNEVPDNNNSIYAPYTVALFSKPENAQCDASKTSPTDPTYGSLGNGLCKGSGNPTGASSFGTIRELLQPSITQTARHFNGRVRTSYIPSAELNFDGTFGIDFTSQRSTFQIPFGNNIDLRENRANNGLASIDDRYHQEVTLSLNGGWTHNMSKNISSTLNFGAQGFITKDNDESSTNQNFPGPGITVVSGGAQPQIFEAFTSIVNAGYFAQEQLGYKDWMFATVGARNDYNSAFGKTSGGVLYPQASFSIIPSDNPAYNGTALSKAFQTMRFRFALGKAGRQPGAFDKLTTYGPLTSPLGGPGLVPANLGNPNLKPEVSTEWETGMELGFFDNQYSVEFTRWQRTLKDALVSRQFPVTGGFTALQLDNIGGMQAWGWDTKVKAFLVNKANFSADVYANIGFLSQIVTDLGGAPPLKVGGSYPRYRNFIKQGWAPGALFGAALPAACPTGQTKAKGGGLCLQPGQFAFDVNKDGVPDDATTLLNYLAVPRQLAALAPLLRDDSLSGSGLNNYLGKPTPDFQGSLGGSITWHRNWHLSTNFEYKFGHYTITDLTGAFRRANATNGGNTLLRAQTEATMLNPASTPDQRLAAAKVWLYQLAGLSPYDGLNQNFSGDFLRWRELSITYTAPLAWAARLGASDLQLTLSGQNIALWTKYPGVDPEINVYSRGGANSTGGGTNQNFGEAIDAFGIPLPRRVAFNVRVTY
ncbi:MAG: SusC/RagA family TonB-linked outer membrane protein [Gemmatimonadetes bacterium]|nr:SusC/RagA family TonB-linked outer membrane protein [Gemmatimonadota bacterium]MBI3566770.1 SusC/RagA family TonB-linked outer membrane protein [Gemmatimonadota bacterium]